MGRDHTNRAVNCFNGADQPAGKAMKAEQGYSDAVRTVRHQARDHIWDHPDLGKVTGK